MQKRCKKYTSPDFSVLFGMIICDIKGKLLPEWRLDLTLRGWTTICLTSNFADIPVSRVTIHSLTWHQYTWHCQHNVLPSSQFSHIHNYDTKDTDAKIVSKGSKQTLFTLLKVSFMHCTRENNPSFHPHLSTSKLKQEPKRATYRKPEYNVPHLLPHLGFLIGPKNTNLVADVEILLPIKFRQIQFSGFRAALRQKIPLLTACH